MKDSTIAAISTAYGEAGIGIVRMSGPDSLEVLKKVFVPFSAKDASKAVSFEYQPRHMYYGRAVDPDDGSTIDECLAVYMPGPYSYTGEDVAEVQCHGSIISYKKILSAFLDHGAVLAERGEFTKRAFMNGRMDLAQAEAVIDLIKARSSRSFDCAVEQLSGRLSESIKNIRKQLLDLLVDLTVNMDYPDEDIEELTYKGFLDRVSAINDEVLKLKNSSGEGRILKEGLRVAIVGKPNVGKSSILNLLLDQERSIVTDVPGTTRDTIEEQTSIRGITICFVDTAGIHESDDKVESIGIERSKDAFNKADLLLIVMDLSRDISEEDRTLIEMAEGRPAIIIYNKTDLGEDLPEWADRNDAVALSAKTGEGLDKLEDRIEQFVSGGKLRREDDVIVTNMRHAKLLADASEELQEASGMIKRSEAMDIIEININRAYELLGEITGDTAGDDVLSEVFSRFCLGK